MVYYCKFDESGHRDDTITQWQVEAHGGEAKLLADGYIKVPDEDYQMYVGNKGNGDNGTGYIRGKDGKPISAPAAEVVITTADKAPVNDTVVALAEAVAAQESRLTALEGGK